MNLSLKKWYYIVLPVLWLLVFSIDVFFSYTNIAITEIKALREVFIVLIILILIPFIRGSTRLFSPNVVQNLRNLIFILLAVYLLTLLATFFFRPQIGQTVRSFFITLRTVLFINWVSFVTTILMLIAVFIVRDLIVYKPKKHTGRYFKFFVYLFVVAIIMRQPAFDFEQNIIQASTIIFGIGSFFISFRNSWVNYLNKKQKLIALGWGSLLLLGILGMANVEMDFLNVNKTVEIHSSILAAFFHSSSLFIEIYIGMAIISILLHLPTAALFDRKIREVTSLQELSRAINSELDFKRLIDLITKFAREVLDSQASWLLMRHEGATHFTIVSAENLTFIEQSSFPFDLDSGIFLTLVRDQKPLLVSDIRQERVSYELLRWKKLGSLVAVPLVSGGMVIGVLFAAKSDEFGFEQDDATLISAFANQAAIAIENSRLITQVVEKERMAQELRIARQVQLSLLPQKLPQHSRLDISAVTISAMEVGGDYYDFITYENQNLSLVIADVSGKGTQAAFYMSEVKGIVQALSRIYQSPKEMLIRVNEALYGNMERQSFITLIYAQYNAQEHSLCFARAGHCPAIHWSGGKARLIQPLGLGLGLDSGAIFDKILEEYYHPLNGDETFVFYTDGVTEARNEEGEEFGEERLLSTIYQYSDRSANDLQNEIIGQIKFFMKNQKMHDDITLVVLKTKGG